MSLSGKTIVVTRREGGAGKLGGLLRDLGANVLDVPTIEILPPEDPSALENARKRLASGDLDWIAFTSANGVEGLLAVAGGPVPTGGAKIAAVGTATASRLEQLGYPVDLIPDSYTAAALAEALGEGTGRRILLPRAEVVPPDMVQALRSNGWETEEVVAYRTVALRPEGPDPDAVARSDFDIATFTSASTVAGFVEAFGTDVLEGKLVACIGPVTAAAAAGSGLDVGVVASRHTLAGLVDALVESMGR